jgi:hypothetical protein
MTDELEEPARSVRPFFWLKSVLAEVYFSLLDFFDVSRIIKGGSV